VTAATAVPPASVGGPTTSPSGQLVEELLVGHPLTPLAAFAAYIAMDDAVRRPQW
jgi:hypothetical protein